MDTWLVQQSSNQSSNPKGYQGQVFFWRKIIPMTTD
jgi:hypothetical protein